ncbi:zinc transporter ZupT [Candidatus Woesearchaeota archaeon]|nr:zinc transporter ZupT [Candidatus Woesearchaeota archaeon]
MDPGVVWFAFTLTLLAGLSTGIGSLLVCCTRHTNKRFLAGVLGFSAGVMVYVSFAELLGESQRLFIGAAGTEWGPLLSVLAFFAGILIAVAIDRLVPSFENPHHYHCVEDLDDKIKARSFRKLYRIGLITALVMTVHNFPEGIATFMTAISDHRLGVAIAFAIAIHNIPEGIAVAVPIHYATKSRKKAVLYSFLTGFAEPLGAVVAYLMLLPFLSDQLFGALFGAVAGIMVFISFDQLLPAASEFGEQHLTIVGLVAGMAVMAVSLLIFL